MQGLLPRLADSLARFSARFVPDAFAIACLLVLVVFVAGITVGGATPAQCVAAWGRGFWELLALSMQIAVVIFAGYVVAVSPIMTRALDACARLPRSPRQAVAWTAFLSMTLCWLNWGVGLIAAAVLVRAIGRRHPHADYRLLVAVAYLGLGLTWHAGPSGSVPLLLATPGSFMVKDGLLAAPVGLGETIFTWPNLLLTAVVVVGFSAFAALLHPPAERTLSADAVALGSLAAFEVPPRPAAPTPAERLMFGRWLNLAVGGLGLWAFALQMGAGGRFGLERLTLDSVNLLFLSLGIALHPHPASLVRAGEEAARSLHGIVLQFPLYAGIYGIMKGTALATTLTQAFVALAGPRTFEFVIFWYSAFLDYFVPSGGGKWAIEAPYVLGAGKALGVAPAAVAMAYAYGDMAANLIQPFWAIPLLGVARLEFRDILGYEILVFLVYSVLTSVFLLAF